MRKSIDTYVQSIAHDNAQYIKDGGYKSIADYIITISENADCGWFDMFDDSELDGDEPSTEQIDELKNYLNDNYNYLPE
jgi:hypothetical protein|nr:MAG TPA: hypothetical protein [Caudoviricetes sp.]